jgi:UDP-N-acetylmuramoyl-L-alanyl-D-glutamate--2,6-diaminopimelate ligase
MPAEILKPSLTLDRLLGGLAEAPPLPVTGISSDSRRIEAGNVFIASQGATAHGLEFLAEVQASKAAAVLWDPATASEPPADVPLIPVENLDSHIGAIANRWFDTPSKRIRVTGVTGTNGKTTIAYLVMQCYGILGSDSAYIGTLGSGIGELSGTQGMTTPACVDLHRLLAAFADAGAEHAAVEVSSHGIEQNRVSGVHFDTAIFTNLSRDHIDYHGSMSAYGESKARLFLEHDVNHRIVNIDGEFGRDLAERIGPDVIVVSTNFERVTNGKRHVFVRAVVAGEQGSRVSFTSSWGGGEFMLPLPGDFNVANAAEVLAAMLCRRTPLREACDALERVSAPPGRMQRVRADADAALPAVYVDYAHTPASLEVSLRALRRHCSGRIRCVFGCGGDRDRGKRALMGKVAARHADECVVTNDNPRSEPPADIIAAILEGMDEGTLVIEDRGAAIAHAIASAAEDDVVLIAGKGHETRQVIGSRILPFSDYESARACLLARSGQGA